MATMGLQPTKMHQSTHHQLADHIVQTGKNVNDGWRAYLHRAESTKHRAHTCTVTTSTNLTEESFQPWFIARINSKFGSSSKTYRWISTKQWHLRDAQHRLLTRHIGQKCLNHLSRGIDASLHQL
jgi:hypothetical protein